MFLDSGVSVAQMYVSRLIFLKVFVLGGPYLHVHVQISWTQVLVTDESRKMKSWSNIFLLEATASFPIKRKNHSASVSPHKPHMPLEAFPFVKLLAHEVHLPRSCFSDHHHQLPWVISGFPCCYWVHWCWFEFFYWSHIWVLQVFVWRQFFWGVDYFFSFLPIII